MEDLKYLRVRDKQHTKILMIRLKFLEYKLSEDFYKFLAGHFDKSMGLNKSGVFNYMLIDDDKNVTFIKNKYKKIFPKEYPAYDEITIEELTER